jgi:hypothetical protein
VQPKRKTYQTMKSSSIQPKRPFKWNPIQNNDSQSCATQYKQPQAENMFWNYSTAYVRKETHGSEKIRLSYISANCRTNWSKIIAVSSWASYSRRELYKNERSALRHRPGIRLEERTIKDQRLLLALLPVAIRNLEEELQCDYLCVGRTYV